jgi:hypothetical protein
MMDEGRAIRLIKADGRQLLLWCAGEYPECRRACTLIQRRRGKPRVGYDCDGQYCVSRRLMRPLERAIRRALRDDQK